MSNIVEPQITETKPSAFGDFIKNNPKFINDLISGGFPAQQKPAFQQNNGEPYVFLKDFSFINSTTDGSIGSNMVNYKKDQVVYPFPSIPNAKYMVVPAFTKAINEGVLVPQKTAQQQAQLEIAKQQAVMQEMTPYSGLTDKVFGKQGGWSFERPMRIGAYIIVGAVVGRYVAKNMGKSTTLGMVIGGLAPLLAYQLSIEYDRKNMPKQEPKQPVAIEPTPTPMPNKPNAMPLDPSVQELYKTPNEFTIKSNGFNTKYYKDVSKTQGIFSFASPNLYKQPYSTNGMSGVQPTKISTREFLDAYNEFLKQPK